MIAAHAGGHDPVAPRTRDGEIRLETQVRHLVGVARLGALLRVGPEPEEAPGQGPLVAARGPDEAPFLDGDATLGNLPVVEPASPDEAVPFLALGGVGQEGAQELAASLLPEIDVGDGEATPETHVLAEEEL